MLNPKNGRVVIRESQSSPQADILIAGDCCPRLIAEERILNGQAKEILAPLQDIFAGADLSLIQFETPLTTDDTPICKSGPNIRCHPDTIALLHAWGGHVALLANNHIGDYGPKPAMDTIAQLHANGFQTVGAGENLAAAYQPLIRDVKGIRVGILNFAENEFGSATPERPGAAPLSPSLNARQINDLAKKVDCCLVVLHGGNEQNPLPSPRVVEMCRTFIDAGAAMVVNIHTHCPQGVELWHGKPIVYSLGNFYFPERKVQADDPTDFWYTGYMVRFSIDKGGATAMELIPTTFSPEADSVRPLSDKQREGFFNYINTISAPIADMQELRRFFECWAACSGYPRALVKPAWTPEDFDAPAPNPKLLALRNLLTCEAHNELITTYLRLVEEGRREEALARKPQLDKLGKATFMLE
ncbi:MAG: CapA family protein [Lentisphaerae bacterium]|jgi:poly-gamma-glutamate synthesis protein (capsule biosynthesis protein)|nr:CapA family protein [Lentisphaerota bacterium]